MSPGELAGNAVTQQIAAMNTAGREWRPRSPAGGPFGPWPGIRGHVSPEAETGRREEKRMSVVTERAESRRALSPPSSAAAQQRAASRLVQRSVHEPPDCRRVVVGVHGRELARGPIRAADSADPTSTVRNPLPGPGPTGESAGTGRYCIAGRRPPRGAWAENCT